MLGSMTDALEFHGKALQLRATRQEAIASNIANADTPHFKAKDFDFSAAMREVAGKDGGGVSERLSVSSSAGGLPTVSLHRTHSGHQRLGGYGMGEGRPGLKYVQPEQASMDGNTVDLNRERAEFSQNAVGYEASLRFINSQIKTMMTAIRGE